MTTLEYPYVPEPVTPADWQQDLSARKAALRRRLVGETQSPGIGTSVQHLALIDETLALDSFHRRVPTHQATLVTLKNAPMNPNRVRRLNALDHCLCGSVVFAHKIVPDETTAFWKRHTPTAECSRAWSKNYTQFNAPAGGVLAPMHCHTRACPTCNKQRRIKLGHLFHERAKAMKRIKFITLTLKHTDTPLLDQCHRIKEAFRRLRARAVWKQLVSGGFWVLEVKRSSTDGLWHVHIHAIIDAKYVPQDWLSAQWLQITRDSNIVDIRQCKPKQVKYLTKYIAKGTDLTDDGEKLWQYFESLHRSRDTNTFGECPTAPKQTSDLVYVGVSHSLIADAKRGGANGLWVLPLLEQLLQRAIRQREEPT